MVDSRREKAAEKFAPKKSKGARYDVLITTPNRLVGLLERKPKPGVSLKNVECLVVDESDKLFETNSKDGGFRQQLATIYKACVNPKIQLAMFSATYQSNVEEWCRQHLDNVVEGLPLWGGGRRFIVTLVFAAKCEDRCMGIISVGNLLMGHTE